MMYRSLVALTLSLAFVPLSWMLYGGYLTDDSYIHFVYARNLAEGYGLSFNPSQNSYGSTSPFWVVLLGLGTWLGFETPSFAQFLSLSTSALCLFALTLITTKIGTNRFAQLLPPLVLFSDPWFQRWSVSGMEVGLAAFLVLVGFYLAFVVENSRSRNLFLGGLLFGLAVLTRPEAALLIAISGLFVLLTGGFWKAFSFGCGGALPLGAWVIFAYMHFGTIIPNSFIVKLRQVPSGFQSAIDSIVILGASTAIPIVIFGLALLVSIYEAKKRNLSMSGFLFWIIPLLWTAGAILQYSHRGVNVATRYLCLYSPLLLMASSWGIEVLGRFFQELRWTEATTNRVLFLVLIVAVIQPIAVGALTWESVKKGESSYSDNHHAIAQWLDEHAAPTDAIATFDVGIIAYQSRRQIVDLAGLTDTLSERDLRRNAEQKVLSAKPAYVVMQGKAKDEFLVRYPGLNPYLKPVLHTEMFWGPGPQQMDIFTIYQGSW